MCFVKVLLGLYKNGKLVLQTARSVFTPEIGAM